MFSRRSLAIAGIYLSVFTNSLMFTIVFPIASRMIMFFGLVDSRTETGYWVGLLGGVMMLGRFLSSPTWGLLCDKWGRRPVILIGTITTSVLSILFGLSTTYIWALIIRFLQGLLSPITLATRTIIAEMYPGKQQAGAMSCFILIGQLGNISGNIIGGYFEEPKNTGIQLFTDFPFLLPNLITGLIGMLSLIICLFFLKETRPETSDINYNESRNFWNIAKDPIVFKVILIFSLCSFNSSAIIELIVLWMWADKENGGFSLTTEEIGTVSAVTSLMMVLYIKTLYGKVNAKFGLLSTIRGSLKYSVPLLLCLPVLSITNISDIWKWPALILGTLVYYSVDLLSITSSMILINNAVFANERGKLNGLSMAVGNLARGASPAFFGFTFAVTAKSSLIYPFNYSFSFNLLAALVAFAWWYSSKLHPGLDGPRIVKNDLSSEMITISSDDKN